MKERDVKVCLITSAESKASSFTQIHVCQSSAYNHNLGLDLNQAALINQVSDAFHVDFHTSTLLGTSNKLTSCLRPEADVTAQQE